MRERNVVSLTGLLGSQGVVPTNKGTLALAGSGEYTPGMEAVDTYLLSRIAGEPRVVCLPTAAGREAPERIAYWSNLGIKHLSRLGVACESVEVVDRSTAQSKPLALQIAEANFVYPSGGDAVYLYRTLLGTETWTAIEQVLEKGGVVAGCSAGAMIWGERIPSAKPPPWAWESGFNSIPGSAIIPHFDEVPRWLLGIYRAVNFSRPPFIGIEGNTALVAFNGQLRIVGMNGVTFWGAGVKRRFEAAPPEHENVR